jgi:2-oxoglutarate ferredoxin oxidoreductase subunit gamma
VITAAILLGEAAVIHEGINAVQSQSYGAAARGGATRSDIILSDTAIDFPVVTEPHIVVCLTQEAYTSFAPEIRPGGIVLTDIRFVQIARKVDARQIELPMFETVMREIGKPIVFNICVLGALIGLADLVRSESILKAIADRVPADFVEINTRAFHLGFDLGRPFHR